MSINNPHHDDTEPSGVATVKDRWRRILSGRIKRHPSRTALTAAGLAAAAALTLAAPASAATTTTQPCASAVTITPNNYTFVGLADWNRDGFKDILACSSVGELWVYPGDGKRPYSTKLPGKIGAGFNGYTFVGVGDITHDGYQDVVARDPNGNLHAYGGRGQLTPGGWLSDNEYGSGWSDYTFAGIIDWNRDGWQDIVARDNAGNLAAYSAGAGRYYPSTTPRTSLGTAWDTFTYAGLADVNRDLRTDVVAKDSNGVLWNYRGPTITGTNKNQIGNGWQSYTFAGITDWDYDGWQDIIARDDQGKLWLYYGDSTMTYDRYRRVQIGNGW